MRDRVLKPDELPVLWQLSQEEQQRFISWAGRLDLQRAKRMAAFERACTARLLNWQARQKQLKLFPDMEEE